MTMERLENLSDEVTEGRSNVRVEKERVERGGSNLACSALCRIQSTVIHSTCSNHWSLRWLTLSNKVVWLYLMPV